jgi:ABC-type sulfate transport system permease subunit
MKAYNDDGSYVKKDKRFGYRVIYPYKNNDGTINWFNLCTGGSWAKLVVTILIVSLILFSVYAYKTDVKTCYEVIKNPCDYCNLNPTMIDTNLIVPNNIYLNSSSSQVAFIRENERGVAP